MKLEEIQEFWHKDREIDYSELGTESIRIPQIHDKYLKIYTVERIRLRSLEFELAKLVRAKTDLYSGRMPEEDIEKRGWEPFLGRLLKNEISNYIESDDDFNWNYGITLAATNDYKLAEETLLKVQSEKYKV